MTSIEHFDLRAPLPDGTTVLEASAGTGKTFTIAGLVTRWVAEHDVPLRRMLVMTFTRAATAELRDRVRQRLVSTADHLEALGRGEQPPTDDPVLQAVADADPDERALRRDRLVRALADIDLATISTIHGFCQHVLDGLGIASDLDRDAELVEDVRDLIEEVADDLLVATYLDARDRPWVTRRDLLALAHTVVANPTTRLVPRGDVSGEAGVRLHLAHRVRREVERRSRRRRLLSYDDLLIRLEQTLRDPDRADAARDAMRERYQIALIDEFQDTDPVQWSIVQRAFGDAAGQPGRALVLIGDPKQAIYAFRGADVYAYLAASRAAHDRRTLHTNWRSDAQLLDALGVLFDGATFGDADIPFRPVSPAPGHQQPRLEAAPDGAALRLRTVPRHPDLKPFWRGRPNTGRTRELIADDVAADIVSQLQARPELIERDHRGAETRRRPLAPRDIAVLVRTHQQATLVQAALLARSVPSVVGGAGSVFATDAASDWQRLLDAIERPTSAARVRALALTAWFGWTADQVAAATDADWDAAHEDVHEWAQLLRDRGLATMQRTVMLRQATQARLLEQSGGERRLADLEHIGELLHAAATAEHLGPATLAGWLRARIQEADDDATDDRLRRLETDDEAVQILTIHRSKGLQFPVVYCPFLWSSNTSVRGAPVFHDEHGERLIDIGGSSHDNAADNKAKAEQEARGEELRLLYVALTRAKHQVVMHYAPAGQPEWSGLGRVLLCRDDGGPVDCDVPAPPPEDETIARAVQAIAARCGGAMSVAEVPAAPATDHWLPPATSPPALDRARFTRGLDLAWRRTSYSALTRFDDLHPRVGSEVAVTVKDDETIPDDAMLATTADSDMEAMREVSLPLADLPGGTDVGTFVHGVLEHTDFAADDLDGALRGAVARMRTRMRLPLDDDLLVDGLAAAITTPLGAPAGGLALRDVVRADRRDEVEFELPLDGAGHGRPATVRDIAALLRQHLPADDPLAAYPDRLPAELLERNLRGFLGGSIDLLLRREDEAGRPVFHVADYKTNRLGIWGEPLTAYDYRPGALADAMMHGHYPIQALLYAVAAHRLLRWRLPGYDPDVNLGSVLYLFVRGMAGPDTPVTAGQPGGVFAWQLPPALVAATSDLLHGKVPA